MIIDFHTHTFPEKISSKVVRKLGMAAHIRAYTDGSMEGLTASMALAGADYSSMIQDRESLLSQGIIAFGGMHPDYSDYKKEIRRLRENHIAGIKIHPAYQNINLDDIRMLRIIDCASEEGLITLTHAGMDIGIYDRNYCSVAHILKVIDEVHPEKFVLAHMGNWDCWQEVEQDLAGAPVGLDTAFSIHNSFLQDQVVIKKAHLPVQLLRFHKPLRMSAAQRHPPGGNAVALLHFTCSMP